MKLCPRGFRRRFAPAAMVVAVWWFAPAVPARAAVGPQPGVTFDFIEQQTGDSLVRLQLDDTKLLNLQQTVPLGVGDVFFGELFPEFFTAPSVREFTPGNPFPTSNNTIDDALQQPEGPLDVGFFFPSFFAGGDDAVFVDTSGVGTGTGLFGLASPQTAFDVETNFASTRDTLEFVFGALGEPDLIVMTSFNTFGTNRVETVTGDWVFVSPPGPGLGPDLTGDGTVDAADYTVWRDAESMDAPAGDANGDTFTNTLDYVVWRDAFGTSVPAGQVPEPAAVGLALLAVAALARRR